MRTMFYFDCETSGIDPARHCILQIAWIVERDGIEKIRRCFDVKPPDNADLNLRALEVNGFTIDRMFSGIESSVMLNYLYEDIKLCIGGGGGAIPCGHNVRFDLEFLNSALQQTDRKYVLHYGNGSMLLMNRPVCTMSLCHFLNYRGFLKLDSFKLETVCKHFGIPIDAHDAMSDIMATRTLLAHLINAVGESYMT